MRHRPPSSEIAASAQPSHLQRDALAALKEGVIGACGLVALALLTFSPSIAAGTIWDDKELIFDNPHVVGSQGLGTIWIAPATDDYFPLTYSMFWLEYRLWGYHFAGYHVVNVLLHALAAVFIWRVLCELEIPAAYAAAAVFTVHPVCVASVAWISEGKNTLSLALGAAAVWAYLKFDSAGSVKWYLTSLTLFLLALLAKTSLVMVPAVLLLLVWWRRDRCTKADVLRVLPFFALSLALGIVTLHYQHNHAMSGGDPRPEGILSRIAATGWCLAFYASKDVLPGRLAMIYPRWSVSASSLASWLPLFGVIGLFIFAWAHRLTWGKAVLLAMGYFAAILLPVLGLVTMAFHVHSLVADHLQYVGVIGPVALVVSGASAFISGRCRSPYGVRLAAVVLVATLALVSWQQASFYRSGKELWAQSLSVNDKSFAAHMNYGKALWEEGAVDEALQHLDKSLRLQPGHPDLHERLAALSFAAGKLDWAIANYREAVRLVPDNARVHYNLAVALQVGGDLSAARKELREALRLHPGYAEAYNNLGKLDATEGHLSLAMESFRKALTIDDGLSQPHYNLGRALESTGNSIEATTHYRRALAIRESYLEAHNNLAWILATHPSLHVRNPKEALRHAMRASQLSGHKNAAVLDTLAAAYASAGQFDQAAAVAAKAVRLAQTSGLPVESELLRRLEMFRNREPYVSRPEKGPLPKNYHGEPKVAAD
jgi:tetratricopeptide (TPR) repeat protein